MPDVQLSFVERRGVYWIGCKQRRWWSLVLAIPVSLHLIDGVNHCLEPASTTRMPDDLTVSKTLLRVLAAFLILGILVPLPWSTLRRFHSSVA